MKKLIIIGAGGHASETAFVAKAAGFKVIGFLDEDVNKHGKIIGVFPCIGPLSEILRYPDCQVTIAIGKPEIRKRVCKTLTKLCQQVTFATIIHPSVLCYAEAPNILPGTVLFPNVVVSTNVQIGRHTIINTNSSVSHDAVLESFVTVSPSVAICGNAKLLGGVEIGAGATVIQGVTIEENTMVGAGAVVTQSLKSDSLYVGVPAKLKRNLAIA